MENQKGRTMIEMLGVLAIAGVLSVGGIAGYSKAMTKYKINRWSEEMFWVTHNFITYQKDWLKIPINKKTGTANVTKYMRELGLLPETWNKYTETEMSDSLGNLVTFATISGKIFYRIAIVSERAISKQLCLQYWENLIIPYSEFIFRVHIYEEEGGNRNNDSMYYGNNYCTQNKRCIRDLQISDIVAKCTKDMKSKTQKISVYFN